MIKTIVFTISVMLLTFHNCPAQNTTMNDIKEIWVYEYFSSKGYTRGEIYTKFKELEQEDIRKHKLDDAFVDSLKHVFSLAKSKKILPGKCGTNLIFTQFVLNNSDCRNIIIGTNGVSDYYDLTWLYFDDIAKNEYWIDYYNNIKAVGNKEKLPIEDDGIQVFEQIYELKVHQFSELLKDLLDSIGNMGIDNSLIIREGRKIVETNIAF